MLDQMKALAREKNTCVLATDAGGKPYCSLMAYVRFVPVAQRSQRGPFSGVVTLYFR